jgi:hypothetical protein
VLDVLPAVQFRIGWALGSSHEQREQVTPSPKYPSTQAHATVSAALPLTHKFDARAIRLQFLQGAHQLPLP